MPASRAQRTTRRRQRRTESPRTQQPTVAHGTAQPQRETASDVVQASRMLASGGPLSADGLVSLQRTAGNRATAQVARRGGPPIQRLWTTDRFRQETAEGALNTRGATTKAIEALIKQYYSLGQPVGADIGTAVDIVLQIKELIEIYKDDHSDDSARVKRTAAMDAFLNEIVTKDLPTLKKFQEQRTGDSAVPEKSSTPGEALQKIRARHEGSADSLFTRLGWMLNAAVPNEGDKAELEIEVKIPVDPSGVGYLGGRVKVEAERDETITARTEVALTGGGKISSAVDMGGELGFYLESAAKTPEDVMRLASYGMYRRFRESSVIPREIASFAWGGTSSSVGYKRSERWASKVEEQVFGGEGGEDASVETGGLAGVTAEANVGVAKVEGGVSVTSGKKYTKASVDAGRKGNQATLKMPKLRGAQKGLGQGVTAVEISAGANVGPLSGEGSVTFKFAQPIGESGAKGREVFDGVEGELTAGITLPGGPAAPVIPIIVAGVGSFADKIASNGKADKKTADKTKELDAVADSLKSAMGKLGGQGGLEAQFGEGFSTSRTIELGIGFEKEADKPVELTISVMSTEEKSLDLDVLSGKMKKSKRVFALKYAGSWTLVGGGQSGGEGSGS